MENPTPHLPLGPANAFAGLLQPDRPTVDGQGSTRAERQARADWLVTELGRLAATADDPHERAQLRRTADSVLRLAIAFRS
jgi:hypothetical protein